MRDWQSLGADLIALSGSTTRLVYPQGIALSQDYSEANSAKCQIFIVFLDIYPS